MRSQIKSIGKIDKSDNFFNQINRTMIFSIKSIVKREKMIIFSVRMKCIYDDIQ